MIFFIVLIAESRLGFGLADILFQKSRYEGDACIKHDLSLQSMLWASRSVIFFVFWLAELYSEFHVYEQASDQRSIIRRTIRLANMLAWSRQAPYSQVRFPSKNLADMFSAVDLECAWESHYSVHRSNKLLFSWRILAVEDNEWHFKSRCWVNKKALEAVP